MLAMRLMLPLLFALFSTGVGLCQNGIDSSPQMISRRSIILPTVTSTLATVVEMVRPKPANAASTVSEGMSAFASGDIEKSIAIYDTILSSNPQYKPYLWQRGLSLYYANRFQDGADQFAADVAVNPNDTEEQIWHLLCLAQVKGSLDKARPFKLTVGRDRRPVMRTVQSLFLSGSAENEDRLVQIAQQEEGDGNKFYASLYLSLYYESMGKTEQAQRWMVQAVKTNYSQRTGVRDPMVELAKVALQKRGWLDQKV